MNIQFSPQDLADARAMAVLRHSKADENGNQNLSGLKADEAKELEIDLVGALGEVALAKALGESHQLAEGTFKAADHKDRWGTEWHVRATTCGGGRLIVRERDQLSGMYALVYVDVDGATATIAGYIRGQHVSSDGEWSDGGNGREPAWWISRSGLLPLCGYNARRDAGQK